MRKDIREVLRDLGSFGGLPAKLQERIRADALIAAQVDEAGLARITESYSQSAWDASSGACILQSILSLVGNEVDEPDEVKLLLDAYGLISQWMALEVAEIGTADDEGSAASMMSDAGMMDESQVALVGDLVMIEEKAVRRDGTVPIKLIQPGWGSSGFYSQEVLERDGPKAFPAGTKMYWDHPTETEEAERPERSLKDLAAVLVTPATYNKQGPAGEGLYADSQVFSSYRGAIDEIAPYIGTSIRAWGRGHEGVVEGKKGQIIDGIVAGQSVDFVTAAGAGGQILTLFEAARNRPVVTPSQEDDVSEQELREAQSKLADAEKASAAALAEAARANEALALREARDVIAETVGKADLHDATRIRLVEQLVKAAPIKDGKLDTEALAVQVEEAVKSEVAYLAAITGSGQIRDMGGAPVNGGEVKEADLAAAFRRMGLSESAAKSAAQGRE